MVQFKTLHLFLCVMGFLSETLSSLTLEAEVGDKVTIWCQHNLTVTTFIFWFKNTHDSVPLLLGCKKFRTSAPSEPCYFFTESERTVMSVYDRNTSLTITAVNVSDTGLYYCSVIQQVKMVFSNSTSLQVKGVNKSKSEDKGSGSVPCLVFFMLTVVFGVVIVILLCVLIFIILKHRKTHRGAEATDNEVPDLDSVNYAAVHFTKKKIKKAKRHDEKFEPHVVYSSIR